MTKDNPGIVILGVPRSGTTLLRRLLNAHPNISCRGETFVLRAAAQFLDGDTIVDGIDYGVIGGMAANGIDRETLLLRLREFAFGFFEDMAHADNKPRWASKTAVDSFYLRSIEQICADKVRYVCIVRNGFDAVCSLKDLCVANEVYIRELHEYVRLHPRLDEAMAYAWRDVTAALLDLTDRRKSSSYLLRYEDLVADPHRSLSEIFDFIGESMDETLIQRALTADDIGGLGDWKTYDKSSIDASSVGRHRDLSAAALSRIARIINPVAENCGYETLSDDNVPNSDEAMRRYELAMMMNAARNRERAD